MSIPATTAHYTNLAPVVSTSDCPSFISQGAPSTNLGGDDVLICGACSAHFSEIRLFIEHKQRCGNNMSHHTTSEINDGSTSNQHSHYSPQQVMLPTSTASSLMSLPVGMPHVIFPTSGGAPQMYRLVLEQSAPINQAQVLNSLNSSPLILDQLTIEPYQTEKISSSEPMQLMSGSVVRLSPVESGWAGGVHEMREMQHHHNEGPLKDVVGTTAALQPEEEDVATFLASQLATQSTSHSSIKRDTEFQSKYCDTEMVNVELLDHKYVEESKHFELNSNSSIEVAFKQPLIKALPHKVEGGGPSTNSKQNKKFCTYENCNFSSRYKKDLLRHIRKHTGEKPYECSECQYKFSRADKLNVHMRIHTNQRPYACVEPGCTYRGREKASLSKHLRTHTNERPYKCQLCPYQAKDGSQLTVHLRSHTGDTPFHCQKEGCMAAFKTSSDLRRHDKMHTGEKPYKCSLCDYATGLKPNLKVHVRINHCKDVKYSCHRCAFVANTRKQLREHERSHVIGKRSLELSSQTKECLKEFKVEEGKKQCSSASTYRNSRGYYTRWKKSVKDMCLKNYKCDICNSGFVRLDSYRSHMRQHMKNKNSTQTLPEDSKKPMDASHSFQSVGIAAKGHPAIQMSLPPTSKDNSLINGISIHVGNSQEVSGDVQQVVTPSGSCNTTSYDSYVISLDGSHSMFSNAPKIPTALPVGPNFISNEELDVISNAVISKAKESTSANSIVKVSNHDSLLLS